MKKFEQHTGRQGRCEPICVIQWGCWYRAYHIWTAEGDKGQPSFFFFGDTSCSVINKCSFVFPLSVAFAMGEYYFVKERELNTIYIGLFVMTTMENTNIFSNLSHYFHLIIIISKSSSGWLCSHCIHKCVFQIVQNICGTYTVVIWALSKVNSCAKMVSVPAQVSSVHWNAVDMLSQEKCTGGDFVIRLSSLTLNTVQT